MSLRWILIVIVVALASYLAFLSISSDSIAVVRPVRGPAVEAVYATGTVEAIMVPIASRIAARLSKLNVDEGDEVSKDQVLAELETEDLKGALAALQADESFARSEFERNDDLRRKGVISSQEYERSKASWERARGVVAEARARVGFLTLVAPSTGRIIRRDGEVGELIPANQPVFWVSTASPLRITAEVDEEDIAQVKVGQEVVVRADAFSGKVFRGKVASITPKGDPVARSYRVRVSLQDQTPLQIGMTAEINIVLSEKSDALLVPRTAIVDDHVWVVSEGKLKRRSVEVGVRGFDHFEIIEGVSPEDMVVELPDSRLVEGSRMRGEFVGK